MPRSLLDSLEPIPADLPLGPNSLSWRIALEPSLLMVGGRALLMQVTHPLVAAGVAQHSNYKADPWSRLFSTLDTVSTMSFSDPAASARAGQRLQRRHRAVNGVAEDGTPYDALDPTLLLWVWATLVDSALVIYERSLGPLDVAVKQRYLDEQKLLGYACGIPAGGCPESYAEFAEYVDGIVRDVLRPTTVAREVAEQLRRPPLPAALRTLAGAPLGLVTAGLLPPSLRYDLGFVWGPRQERAFAAFFALVHAQRAVPGRVRRYPAAVASRRDTPLRPPKWLVRPA